MTAIPVLLFMSMTFSAPAQSVPAAAKTKAPAAVEASLKRQFPAAEVKTVSKEKENGQTTYEIETINAGHGLDLVFLPNGTLVESEEELTQDQVPGVVEKAVLARYAKATVGKREKLTIAKSGEVRYELALKGAPVKEVALSPTGAWISPKR
ncbi:MAG: hypothetical protein ABI634_07225 [Acidobacteriota bacterium]